MLRKPKQKHYAISFIVLALALFGIPLMTRVQAADGAAGNVQASAQIFHISGSAISVSMWNLDVSSDYQLNWTGDATGITFTTSATQTTYTHTFVLTSSSNTVVFTLRAQSAGTVLDQVQVTVADITDFLATGLIISAGIFILIVVIFKKVIK